jgi:hypothetical protein
MAIIILNIVTSCFYGRQRMTTCHDTCTRKAVNKLSRFDLQFSDQRKRQKESRFSPKVNATT